jgi:anaerobic magnesium-protoporphyrin IX monomethyl ester cyclase
MRILFIEPPKEFWFILGEYIPPPLGILTLAAYLKSKNPSIEIEVIDCQAEGLDWEKLEKRIEQCKPDIVALSGLSTCNAYTVLKTIDITKKISPSIKTVIGGQHFTALADETLRERRSVDYIVRGEGEDTLTELVRKIEAGRPPFDVRGLSFHHEGEVIHNPDRDLLCELDTLPFPGYNYVEEHMGKYYFSLMTENNTRFAIVESSRGCPHSCSYCTQWRFWKANQRFKSPTRVADEIEHLYNEYGSKFFWLTDDNLELGPRIRTLGEELIQRGLSEEVTWFSQTRCDSIVENRDLLPTLRKAGNIWMLVGYDSPNTDTLHSFKRGGINQVNAKQSIDLLRANNIFSQGTFIIGERKDTHESISATREYADELDPDIATFMALTPFPGTEVYEEAVRNNWIKDTNWSNFDMIHAIMPTETLTRAEVQEELFKCYQDYFGSWSRRFQGYFSDNQITRRIYNYLSKKALMIRLRSLF